MWVILLQPLLISEDSLLLANGLISMGDVLDVSWCHSSFTEINKLLGLSGGS